MIRQTILTHPENLPLLERSLREVCALEPANGEQSFALRDIAFIAGISIQPCEYMPRFAKKWIPPKGRFWEFEASDTWAERLSFGHHEDDPTQPYILVIGEPPRPWEAFATTPAALPGVVWPKRSAYSMFF